VDVGCMVAVVFVCSEGFFILLVEFGCQQKK